MPLMAAAVKGHIGVLKALLGHAKTDPNQVMEQNMTTLHLRQKWEP